MCGTSQVPGSRRQVVVWLLVDDLVVDVEVFVVGSVIGVRASVIPIERWRALDFLEYFISPFDEALAFQLRIRFLGVGNKKQAGDISSRLLTGVRLISSGMLASMSLNSWRLSSELLSA